MDETNATLAIIAEGWHVYQKQLAPSHLSSWRSGRLHIYARLLSWRATSSACGRGGSTISLARVMRRSAPTMSGTVPRLLRGRLVNW